MTDEANAKAPSRRTLIRDAIAFQLKLAADGVRDIVLAPVSLLAALISLLGGGSAFYDVVRVGRRTDHWINLFEAADRIPAPAGAHESASGGDIDAIVDRVESFLVAELNRSGGGQESRARIKQRLRAILGASDRSSTDQSAS